VNAVLPMRQSAASVDDAAFLQEMLLARGAEQARLHEQANAAVNTEFGRGVFIRGVVEISNFCRQNCHYCGMRRSRTDLPRYRIPLEVLQEFLIHHRPSYLTDLNLQAGEDPKAVREIALPLIKELRARTNLGISVGLGSLDPKLCEELRAAGATFYVIKFETTNVESYRRLEAPGDLAVRLDAILRLAATGWHVSSGFIAGLPGETLSDLADALQLIAELPLIGASVSPFVPGCDTPLAGAAPGNIETALNCVALLRLRHPGHIIPAVSAFGRDDAEGYVRALRAGANLATINLTPAAWRDNYPIYNSQRWIMDEERLLRSLEAAGREPVTTSLAKFLEQNHPCS
jgi:biotin synthase